MQSARPGLEHDIAVVGAGDETRAVPDARAAVGALLAVELRHAARLLRRHAADR